MSAVGPDLSPAHESQSGPLRMRGSGEGAASALVVAGCFIVCDKIRGEGGERL